MLHFAVEIVVLLLLCARLPNLVRANHSLEVKSFTRGETPLNTVLDVIKKINERDKKVSLCNSINLNISVVPNNEKYFVDVSFEVSESKFKDCFDIYDYYKITLTNLKKRDEAAVDVRYDKENGASYRFKKIECGSYELKIQPCSWMCYPIIIKVKESINITGIECLVSNKLHFQQQEKTIIVIITIVSVMLILTVGAASFCFYWSAERKGKLKDFMVKKKDGTKIALEGVDHFNHENKKPSRRNEVIILHRYSKLNNTRVYLLEDFLQKTDYYESITTIEYSLSKILFDVKDWLDKMLKTSKTDGGIRKIILIASESDAEHLNIRFTIFSTFGNFVLKFDKKYERMLCKQAEDYEMENLLFSKFLDTINDDSEKCLKGYDHLFVVQFEKQLENHPEEFRNVVRRVRFTLSEELFENHLINLCLNLCSESEQNSPHIERNIRELFSRHPIRYLENPLLDV